MMHRPDFKPCHVIINLSRDTGTSVAQHAYVMRGRSSFDQDGRALRYTLRMRKHLI